MTLMWQIPLERPPVILSAGWGPHGERQLERFPGQPFWTLHAYPYAASYTIGGRRWPVMPGSLSLTPPGMPVEYRYTGLCSHFYVRFTASGAATLVSGLAQIGRSFPQLVSELERLASLLPIAPQAATAYLWAILWRHANPQVMAPDDAASRARHVLEQRLGQTPRLTVLAAELGVSPRHLQRLFHARYGCAPREWLARHRAQVVDDLLRGSDTTLPAIAAAVGITDRQHFNKAVRRWLGAAPQRVRAAKPAPLIR